MISEAELFVIQFSIDPVRGSFSIYEMLMILAMFLQRANVAVWLLRVANRSPMLDEVEVQARA